MKDAKKYSFIIIWCHNLSKSYDLLFPYYWKLEKSKSWNNYASFTFDLIPITYIKQLTAAWIVITAFIFALYYAFWPIEQFSFTSNQCWEFNL